MLRDDLQQAIAHFNLALEVMPDAPFAIGNLSEALRRQGKSRQAKTMLKRASQLHRRDGNDFGQALALCKEARARYENGDLTAAGELSLEAYRLPQPAGYEQVKEIVRETFGLIGSTLGELDTRQAVTGVQIFKWREEEWDLFTMLVTNAFLFSAKHGHHHNAAELAWYLVFRSFKHGDPTFVQQIRRKQWFSKNLLRETLLESEAVIHRARSQTTSQESARWYAEASLALAYCKAAFGDIAVATALAASAEDIFAKAGLQAEVRLARTARAEFLV